MVHPSIYHLLREANLELTSAEKELSRPYEDVVTYAVCQLTKSSIRKLFASYLGYSYSLTDQRERQIETRLNNYRKLGLSNLIKRCTECDQAFAQLDYTALACQKVSAVIQMNSYCIAEENVEECAKLGRKLERLIYEIISSTEHRHGRLPVRIPSEETTQD